jgi:hypothetical protein
MSQLGRVTPSAGCDVIDRKACFLSLLAQATVWLLELRVSRTFLDKLRPRLFRPWIPNSRRCQHFCPRSDRFWLRELRDSRTFLDFLRLICSAHGYPARRATSSTAYPDNREAWGVRGKGSGGMLRVTVRLFPFTAALFHCSPLLSQARRGLEIGPAIDYDLWLPPRESMNVVGASCTQTIRKP